MSPGERAKKRRAMLTVPPANTTEGSSLQLVAAIRDQRAADLAESAARVAKLGPYQGEKLRDGPSVHWIEVHWIEAPVLYDGDGDGEFGRQWRWLNVEYVVAFDSWTWGVDGAELTRLHLATGKALVLDVLHRDFARAMRWRQSLIGRFWLALRRLAWRGPQRLSPPRP